MPVNTVESRIGGMEIRARDSLDYINVAPIQLRLAFQLEIEGMHELLDEAAIARLLLFLLGYAPRSLPGRFVRSPEDLLAQLAHFLLPLVSGNGSPSIAISWR